MSVQKNNELQNEIPEGFDFSKRRFLNTTLAATGLTLESGVILYGINTTTLFASSSETATSAVRWAMLIDVNRCDRGCDACVSACIKENGLTDHGRPETDPQWIRKVEVTDPQSKRTKSLPVMCQHCEKPPCVDVCPTGASFKRDDGIVLVDKHICIGCRYCIMACPYKARSFVHEVLTDQKESNPRGKGTVEGCTMCVHRIDTGKNPACVDACSTDGGKAIIFGDLANPDSEISRRVATYATQRIRSDLGVNPGIRYQNL